jgi:hypothetical protein
VLQAVQALIRRPVLRRLVGVALLVAFVVVVIAGASHSGAHHDQRCAVCVAHHSIGTSESFAAPQLAEPPALAGDTAIFRGEASLARALDRAHAPRGPPSVL